MNKVMRVEKNGKQTWIVVRQMPHDPQYRVGSKIPGQGVIREIRSVECAYSTGEKGVN